MSTEGHSGTVVVRPSVWKGRLPSRAMGYRDYLSGASGWRVWRGADEWCVPTLTGGAPDCHRLADNLEVFRASGVHAIQRGLAFFDFACCSVRHARYRLRTRYLPGRHCAKSTGFTGSHRSFCLLCLYLPVNIGRIFKFRHYSPGCIPQNTGALVGMTKYMVLIDVVRCQIRQSRQSSEIRLHRMEMPVKISESGRKLNRNENLR